MFQKGFEMKDTKQVIVMRKDLNMRKGKMIAQGSHASIAFLTRRIEYRDYGPMINYLLDHEKEWLEYSFKKVCVSVDSEAELLEIAQKANEAGLEVNLITDSGLTEFGGVPTNTCLAIGPNYSDEIDKITGHLKLL
jgi:PTH2 family peptidyl-tRNA hydrolase